jgi:beta-glucosidase
LSAGTTLRFPVAGNTNSRSYLPVVVTDGEVVGTDQHGRPAIVVKQHGAGRAVLCTYPVEYFAARRRGANPEDSWRMYAALADLAGVRPRVQVNDPRVLADYLVHRDGTEYWFLVSECAEPLEVTPLAPRTATLLDGTAARNIKLDPYGIKVLRIPAKADD